MARLPLSPHFLQQFCDFCVHFLGRLNDKTHKKISPAKTAEPRHAFSGDTKVLFKVEMRGNFYVRFPAAYGRHLYFPTEQKTHHFKFLGNDKVASFAHEHRVRVDLHAYVEAACASPPLAGLPHTA